MHVVLRTHDADRVVSKRADTLFPSSARRPFVLVTALFFILGMSNNLTDILVQQFRKSLELSAVEAQLVQTAVFLGYFFMAIPAALFMERRGYKSGILAGLLLFGGGMVLFWPAAITGRYSAFLTALFVVGCGSAVLETAANPFVAQLGSPETSERRLNFSQAFNPPGTITGVLLGTYFIFSGVELAPERVAVMKQAGTYAAYLHTELMRVVPVYVGLGSLVFLWALLVWRTSFPVNEGGSLADVPMGEQFKNLLKQRQLWIATGAEFFYVGAQVSTWSALIPYLKQYAAISERSAAFWLIANLICFAVGRIVSTALMKWVRPLVLVLLYAICNVIMVLAAVMLPGHVGGACLIASSFFMAPMFPTIFASGVRNLGASTKLAGSILVMSIVGGAAIPPLLGQVARSTSSYAKGYGVTALCYVIVAVYAFTASRMRRSTMDEAPVLH